MALLASLAVEMKNFAGLLSELLGFRELLRQPKLAGLGKFVDWIWTEAVGRLELGSSYVYSVGGDAAHYPRDRSGGGRDLPAA